MRITADELSKQAYKKVKKMIVSKKLLPGQKIVQEQLADKLGISRTPLRSALQMLEAESLIKSIPRRGVVVREFSDAEIIEIYDCRIALESTATRLFTHRAAQPEIDRLRSLLLPFEKGEINAQAYQKADSEFHNSLIKNSGNDFLYNLFQKGNLLVCIDMIGLVRPPQETLEEHLDIVSAIRYRDADLAENLIKDHLEKSKQLILKKLENGK
ncbi:GntR family transcriptional regulator [Ulvibacterium marinum]|uniref:GntR family transcriptional regulator n=1 Tax=Ulvibacterium marinum TaxID=2419782 RepID=UPI0024949B47|nr:GntR family transcriptional regulator [Ulvibacterium marinum]